MPSYQQQHSSTFVYKHRVTIKIYLEIPRRLHAVYRVNVDASKLPENSRGRRRTSTLSNIYKRLVEKSVMHSLMTSSWPFGRYSTRAEADHVRSCAIFCTERAGPTLAESVTPPQCVLCAEGETLGPQSGYNGAVCKRHVNHVEGYCFFSAIIQLGAGLASGNEGVRNDRLPMLLPSDLPSRDRKDLFP